MCFGGKTEAGRGVTQYCIILYRQVDDYGPPIGCAQSTQPMGRGRLTYHCYCYTHNNCLLCMTSLNRKHMYFKIHTTVNFVFQHRFEGVLMYNNLGLKVQMKPFNGFNTGIFTIWKHENTVIWWCCSALAENRPLTSPLNLSLWKGEKMPCSLGYIRLPGVWLG